MEGAPHLTFRGYLVMSPNDVRLPFSPQKDETMMNPNRRCFLKLASMAGIGLASSEVGRAFGHGQDETSGTNKVTVDYAVATLEDGSMLSTPFWTTRLSHS